MKLYIVPCFFVCEAESDSQADSIAIKLKASIDRPGAGAQLMLDECLPTVEFKSKRDGDDWPYTMVGNISGIK
jgi:hypothetical protein